MPAPSPPTLKSSIEYFAMSVGIGRTLVAAPTKDPTNFWIHPKINQLSGSAASDASPPARALALSVSATVSKKLIFGSVP